jgi:hypothetical protein
MTRFVKSPEVKQSKHVDSSMIGRRFGRLLVVSYFGNDSSRQSVWNCVCDCGKGLTVRRHAMLSGNTQSCGCLNHDSISKEPGLATLNKLFYRYKRSATKRGLQFTLVRDEFVTLVSEDCFYCGCPPSQEVRDPGFNGYAKYNGVDRLNNEVGYVTGNVVPCCGICNFAKRTMSYSEFKGWVRKISDHLLSKDILYA